MLGSRRQPPALRLVLQLALRLELLPELRLVQQPGHPLERGRIYRLELLPVLRLVQQPVHPLERGRICWHCRAPPAEEC